MNQDPFADSDDSDQTDYEEEDGNVSDTLRQERQPLGPVKSYIPNWRPPHAIREYHQNWFVAVPVLSPSVFSEQVHIHCDASLTNRPDLIYLQIGRTAS
jgi:hypothetical protein